MNEADRMGGHARMAQLGQFDVLGRVPPLHQHFFRWELDDDSAALGPLAFEHRDVVVERHKPCPERLKNGEEAFLVLAIDIGIIHGEVSDEVDGTG